MTFEMWSKLQKFNSPNRKILTIKKSPHHSEIPKPWLLLLDTVDRKSYNPIVAYFCIYLCGYVIFTIAILWTPKLEYIEYTYYLPITYYHIPHIYTSCLNTYKLG